MGRVVQWKMQKLIKSFCSWDLETWPHESLPLRGRLPMQDERRRLD